MHSTIFVLNDNPISENDVIDDDYFSVSQIERRVYDYCGVTNLEYEARDYFSGYYSEFFQTEIMKTEYEDYPEDNFVQYKMTIKNREKFMKGVYKRYRKALKEFSNALTLEKLLYSEDRDIHYLLHMSDLQELTNELMQDPEFKKEYEALQPEMDITRAILDARIHAGMTQLELSEKSGISQADISRLEKGTRNPSIAL